jgi:hypothetical protein
LDLAGVEELSKIRAVGWKVEKVSREVLGTPSQPFIGKGWVSELFSKPITDRGSR